MALRVEANKRRSTGTRRQVLYAVHLSHTPVPHSISLSQVSTRIHELMVLLRNAPFIHPYRLPALSAVQLCAGLSVSWFYRPFAMHIPLPEILSTVCACCKPLNHIYRSDGEGIARYRDLIQVSPWSSTCSSSFCAFLHVSAYRLVYRSYQSLPAALLPCVKHFPIPMP